MSSKKILIFGGSGYVGSKLIVSLIKKKFIVFNYEINLFGLKHLPFKNKIFHQFTGEHLFLGLLSHLKLKMIQKNTFMRKHRNSSCYHFRVRIPLDLQKHFKDKKDFTISLRTGVYRDASRTATRLYTLSQIIFDKIRMQEVDLDHEGVKKILLVEIPEISKMHS